MRTYSRNDKIYLGRGDGLEILKEIKNAKKSVKIVSPYLSSTYLDELVKLNKKGIKITLITSDNLTEPGSMYSFDDSKIIKQKKISKPEARHVKRNLKTISIVIFLIGLFTLGFSVLFFPVVYISIFLFILILIIFIYQYFIKEYSFEYYSIFKIRIFDSHSGEKPWSTNLIHSKIFLIDDKICFLGSANFTWSGFRTHYETVIKIKDQEAIRDISQEVHELFHSKYLSSLSLDDWGRRVYE